MNNHLGDEKLIDPHDYSQSHKKDVVSITGTATDSLLKSGVDYDPFSNESLGKGRPGFSKTFSKIEPSSMRGGIITMVTSALGLGLLTYPKAFSYYGYVLGSVAVLYAASTAIISFQLFCSVVGVFPKHSLYSELVDHFLGRFWAKYTSIIFIIYYYGCCIGYIIVRKRF